MADSALSDDNSSVRKPSIAEVIQRHLGAAIAESIHSWIPARVEKVSGRKVDLQVLVQDFHRDETGALVVAPVPVVTSIAVMLPAAGGFTYTLPVTVGDIGALHFAERSLDRFYTGDGSQVDPGFYTRFNLTDGYWTPGLPTFGAPISPADPTDHATAGSVAGPRIHFRGTKITIGDEAGSKKLGLDGDAVDCGTLTIASITVVMGVVTAVIGQYTDGFGVNTPVIPGQILALPLPIRGKLGASATQAEGH